MFTDRFLRHREGATITGEERAALKACVSEVSTLDPRQTIVRAGETLSHSTLLIDGFLCRYLDDHQGLGQLVAPVSGSA